MKQRKSRLFVCWLAIGAGLFGAACLHDYSQFEFTSEEEPADNETSPTGAPSAEGRDAGAG